MRVTALLVTVFFSYGLATPTTFPHLVSNQWDGGFVAKLYLLVPTEGLCGWEVELNFDQVINDMEPYSFLVKPGQQLNTKTYRIINLSWNGNKAAGQELFLDFKGFTSFGTETPVNVVSAEFKKTCSGSSGSSGSTGSTGSTGSGSSGTSASGFPVTIGVQWTGGFDADICFDVPVTLCGWEMRMDFSHVVNKILPYNFKLTHPQSNSQSYTITNINQYYLADIAAGSELCLDFNGEDSVSESIQVTNIEVVKPSPDGSPCTDTDTTTTTTETTTTTTEGSTVTTTTTTGSTTTTESTTATDSTTTPESTTTTGTTSTTGSTSVDNDYSEVLAKSILFYEAQRSGYLPAGNRIPWRGDSAVTDGSDNSVDLEGGWYDAGDHVKFNFPMAWSTTVLAWGLDKFKQGYVAAGELDNMYDSITWSLTYLLKCWYPAEKEYWAQVGNAYTDHDEWTRPEDLDIARPSYKLTVNNPGSDVTGETAAAFAAASIAFATKNPTYSSTLLTNAESLFDFAYSNRGTYVNEGGIPAGDFYNSWSGYNDELCWAALWLHKATNDSDYLTKASEFLSTDTAPEFSWDNKIVGCQLLMYEADSSRTDLKSLVEAFMDNWRDDMTKTPNCGLSWYQQWGPLRYSANAALIGLMAAEAEIQTDENRKWALSQIDYMMGANNQSRSYVIGYGNNYPLRPHHRSSSCDPDHSVPCGDEALTSPDPNPSVLNGALVGGPNQSGDFTDDRQDYVSNEVACDYNAGFQSVLAGLLKLKEEGNFPDHTNQCCKNQLPFCTVTN